MYPFIFWVSLSSPTKDIIHSKTFPDPFPFPLLILFTLSSPVAFYTNRSDS
jgi:hypothetical protein